MKNQAMDSPPRETRIVLLVLSGGLLLATGFGGGWLAARRGAPSMAQTKPSAVVWREVVTKHGEDSTSAASLLNGYGLQSQINVLRHVADLSLAEVRVEAQKSRDADNPLSMDGNAALPRDALFTRWAELDAEGLLAAAKASGDGGFRASAIESAFKALAKTDAESALRRAGGPESGLSKRWAQRAVLGVLAREDPALAFKLVNADAGLKAGWMDSVIKAWAGSDPAAAAAAALSIDDTRKRTTSVAALMQQWAAKDYPAAAAWADTLGPALRREALSSALQTLSTRNPAEALKALEAADIGENRRYVIENSIKGMAQFDFDSALRAATSFTGFKDRSMALGSLAEAASGADRGRMLQLAAELPANLAASIYQSNTWHHSEENLTLFLKSLETVSDPALRERLLPRAAQSMALFQPAEGGRLFMELPLHARTPDAARLIASRMAERNPGEALRWAADLGAEHLENIAWGAVLDHLEATDPEAAAREIFKISDPGTRAGRIQSLAERRADLDTGKAGEWAAGLTGPDRLAALRAVTEQTANTSLEQARELYQKHAVPLSPEEAEAAGFGEVARAISHRWAEAEPVKAAAWAMALPEGEARDLAVSSLMFVWARDDSLAASGWVNTLPPGGSRDIAAAELVETIARGDPDSAWAWAGNIADPARRREAAAAALDGWKANNRRDEARAALESGNFTDTERQELARRLE